MAVSGFGLSPRGQGEAGHWEERLGIRRYTANSSPRRVTIMGADGRDEGNSTSYLWKWRPLEPWGSKASATVFGGKHTSPLASNSRTVHLAGSANLPELAPLPRVLPQHPSAPVPPLFLSSVACSSGYLAPHQSAAS